jgi:hypothetical protein
MGRACTRYSRARTRFIAYRNYQSRKRFGFDCACLQSHGFGCSHKPPRSALQKYKVKGLDLLFVTVTNSFARKLSEKKLQLKNI